MRAAAFLSALVARKQKRCGLALKWQRKSFSSSSSRWPLRLSVRTDDEETGLILMGLDYAHVSVKKRPEGLVLSQTIVKDAEKGGQGRAGGGGSILLRSNTFYLRVKVSKDGGCIFSYSTDGRSFSIVGEPFKAREGKWIGAKVGLFAVRTGRTRETGYADVDWFRFE